MHALITLFFDNEKLFNAMHFMKKILIPLLNTGEICSFAKRLQKENHIISKYQCEIHTMKILCLYLH